MTDQVAESASTVLLPVCTESALWLERDARCICGPLQP